MLSREGIGNASSTVAAMNFGRKRAAGSLTQFAMLMRRFIDLYWRTPSFNITRFAVSLIQALIFGVLYINADYTTYTGVNAGMGLIFITSLFNGMIPFNAVMPIASQERAVFYRERAAQTYSAVWYWLAETLVEIPYSVASALLFTVIFYPMVGFPGFTEGVLYWVNTSLLILMLTYFGQLFVYAAPSLEIAMILGALCSSVLVMFMGFNPPGSAIPIGYKWLYHITPQKYSMGVFAALVFTNCTDDGAAAVINGTASDGVSLACHMLDGAPAPYTGLSLKEYVEQVFLTKHDELALNFGVQVAFIALFLLVKLLAMRFANHQKR
jgi:ABC-type multidrug transport system permease subunit